MGDFGVIEGAYDLEDTIDSTNVGQEGVSETSSGRCACCETSDINAGKVGGNTSCRFVRLAEPIESFIGYWYSCFLERC